MNKMLIVLLAVCLVSTQAFVKRDAPAASDTNYLETIQKKLQDFSKDFNTQMASTFDAEAMKKNLNAIAESVNKAAQTFVKRDAPTADEVRAKLNVVKNKITVLGNNLGKKITDAIKPEEIKQKFNDAVDVISKALENFKSAGEAKPAAAQ